MLQIKEKKEFLLYLLTLCASVYLYSTLTELSYETRAFPGVALLCLACVCVIGIKRSLSCSSAVAEQADKKEGAEKFKKFCFALLGTVVYVCAIPLMGFYASSLILLLALTLLLGNRRYGLIILTTVIFLTSLFSVFSMFLNVPLPKGVLF